MCSLLISFVYNESSIERALRNEYYEMEIVLWTPAKYFKF